MPGCYRVGDRTRRIRCSPVAAVVRHLLPLAASAWARPDEIIRRPAPGGRLGLLEVGLDGIELRPGDFRSRQPAPLKVAPRGAAQLADGPDHLDRPDRVRAGDEPVGLEDPDPDPGSARRSPRNCADSTVVRIRMDDGPDLGSIVFQIVALGVTNQRETTVVIRPEQFDQPAGRDRPARISAWRPPHRLLRHRRNRGRRRPSPAQPRLDCTR